MTSTLHTLLSSQIWRALALAALTGALTLSACSKEPEQKPEEPKPKVEKKPEEPKEPVDPLAKEKAHSEGKAELVGVDRMDVAMLFASTLEATGDTPEPTEKDDRPRIKMQDRATGSIDAKAAGKVFARYNVAMKRCYERSLKRNPGLEGKVELSLVINTNGKVKRANAKGRSLRDDMVNKCMEGNAMRMEFPPPKGGVARLSKAYTFTPEI